MSTPIIHGLSLAPDAEFKTLNLEVLATDPPVHKAGQMWFNGTEASIKFTDAVGNTLVNKTVATLEDLPMPAQSVIDGGNAQTNSAITGFKIDFGASQ